MRKDLVSVRGPASVHGDIDALAAKRIRNLAHQIRTFDETGINRDLVSTNLKQCAHVLDGANAASHRERHETVVGQFVDQAEVRDTAVGARRDIEEDQFVHLAQIVDADRLGRSADSAAGIETHALDQPSAAVQHCRDDPVFQHGSVTKRRSRANPGFWLFSG